METDGRTSTTASGGVVSSSKPPIANSRARDYAIGDSQEPEQRSTAEISARKAQKINKELAKQNNQLTKEADTLRREKEALLIENQKLKNESKTLERELKKVVSKGEVQRILKNGPAEPDHDDAMVAERHLQERDKKIDALKRRLESKLELLRQIEAADKSEERHVKQKNVGIWDSGTALERLVDEQNVSSGLQKENMELKSKVASLETELEQLLKEPSPKSSRKKSANFFRRSKRQAGEVQKDRLTAQTFKDTPRSRSPDMQLSELLTFDTPSSSVEGTPIHTSLAVHVSPNQSPKLDVRDRRNSEIQSLQSNLKSAIDEKRSLEAQNEALEAELHEVRSQLEQLQAKVDEGRNAVHEVERVKKSLKLAVSEKTSLSGQVQHLRKEVDETKMGRKSAEKNMTESLRRKDVRIEELEEECSRVKKECDKLQKGLESAKAAVAETKSEAKVTTITAASSHTAAKPPSGTRLTSPSHSSTVSKPAQNTASSGSRLTSPSHSSTVRKPAQNVGKPASTAPLKTAPSATASAIVTVNNSEMRMHSSKQTSDLKKLSADLGKSTAESAVPKATRRSSAETVERKTESQSRARDSTSPPKLLKRRSSTELIEMFEHSKETPKPAEATVKRNSSFANLATSVSHRAKVAATRALFEGRNDDESTAHNHSEETSSGSTASRRIHRRSWTSDVSRHRRSSCTDPAPSTIPEGKELVVSHTKSQSCDATEQFKVSPAAQTSSSSSSSVTTMNASSSSTTPKLTTSSVSSKPASLNLSSAAPAMASTARQSVGTTSSPGTNGTPGSATSSLLTPTSAGSKVSKITIKSSSSPSTSPKLNTRKEVKEITVGSSMKAERVTIPVSSTGGTKVSVSSSATTPVRSPTRSPTTSVESNTRSSIVITSSGISKTPSYVPSYIRSNTISSGSDVANQSGYRANSTDRTKAPVTRSQTAVTMKVTSVGPTPQPYKTNVSSQGRPEQSILRQTSLLNVPSDLKKACSLRDIPENVVTETESSSGSSTLVENKVENKPPSSPTPAESVTTTRVVHRSPVQSRIQRRKREERPKTMYAGANRSETVSLVRLISKYQEQEKQEKEGKNANSASTSAISAPASTQVPAVNGNASPIPAAASTFSSSASSAGSSSTSSTVVTSRVQRPQSYYGGSSDL